MKNLNVIGLMSGTSLDGLDVCFAKFSFVNQKWSVSQLITHAFDYDNRFKERLKNAYDMSRTDLDQLSLDFGLYQAEQTVKFCELFDIVEVDFVAAHGHTVFHKPEEGYTLQIGDGQVMADHVGFPVINDFRSLDVSLGGQGAPLVPIGDELLFGEYGACLNLGGFCNISYDVNGVRKAFDISPCNLPLNAIMYKEFGLAYDKSGATAAKGKVINNLLKELNGLSYYRAPAPKSLGFEWISEVFNPILELFKDNKPEDILRTIVEHETDQIGEILENLGIKTVLITGGGAFNNFFIERLKDKTEVKIELPPSDIISFKEALVFGFLGVLKWNNEINTYKSVTGASKDSSGGVLHFPKVNN